MRVKKQFTLPIMMLYYIRLRLDLQQLQIYCVANSKTKNGKIQQNKFRNTAQPRNYFQKIEKVICQYTKKCLAHNH